MSRQGWVETLLCCESNGASVNSASLTSILPPAALYTFPANYFDVGKTLRVTACGILTSNTTGSTNLTIVPLLGSANLAFTGNVITLTAGAVNATFCFEYTSTCRAIGNATTATWISSGFFAGGSATSNACVNLPLETMAAQNANATTGTLQLDLQVLFATGTASESIILQQYTIEAMN